MKPLILFGIIDICLVTTIPLTAHGQDTTLRLAWWNVENYFDPFDDSLRRDDDFTPSGRLHWTWRKFTAKRNALAKTIIALECPEIIGLCEVENRLVLRQLIEQTPLALMDYGIIHRDSPDERGIDVALLFCKVVFEPVDVQFLRIRGRRTREILYVKGLVDGDSLHIFLNHWPSKRGGAKLSRPARDEASWRLRKSLDSIFVHNPEAKIIIAGDFNDTPDSEVIQNLVSGLDLCNEAMLWQKSLLGSLKFQHRWECIDQIIYSRPLKQYVGDSGIASFEFLLERDVRGSGHRPFPTNRGPAYHGGVSDHLPVYLDVSKCWNQRLIIKE